MRFHGLLKQKFKNTLHDETVTITVYAIDFKMQGNL
jgi:hypothetical protein